MRSMRTAVSERVELGGRSASTSWSCRRSGGDAKAEVIDSFLCRVPAPESDAQMLCGKLPAPASEDALSLVPFAAYRIERLISSFFLRVSALIPNIKAPLPDIPGLIEHIEGPSALW